MAQLKDNSFNSGSIGVGILMQNVPSISFRKLFIHISVNKGSKDSSSLKCYCLGVVIRPMVTIGSFNPDMHL
jgi:hypothetical protein